MEVRGSMIWVFLMCFIFAHIIISHKNDFVEAKSFPKFEDLEMQKRLKIINKPAVKIIKTTHGERYGCVDFFKQPAFDHPSMKNHAYHYKMRPIWKGMRERETNSTGFGYLWENGVGCPIGTVPIRRVSKDDLLRIDSFGDNHKPRGSWNTTTNDPNNVVHSDKHHYVVLRTKDSKQRFNGATMDICITAPKVRPTQYSASRVHMQMGRDFIQVGLTVNPVLYKDNQPRTFVYTNSGGKACYNSNCNIGFILVRQDFPLGSPVLPVSIRGDRISRSASFGLIKDQKNGNWWFEFSDTAAEVGFWPSSRFHQSFGNSVEWGGEVYSASLPSPEMGYGVFPSDNDISNSAYMKRITVLDGFYNFDRNVNYLEDFSDDERGYQGHGIYNAEDASIGRILFYGGPGNI